MLHMDAHGITGASFIPLEQKVQDHPVVRHRDILHMLAVLRNLQDLIHSAVNNRIQTPHIFIVGGLDDGQVELLVRQGPVARFSSEPRLALRLLLDLL